MQNCHTPVDSVSTITEPKASVRSEIKRLRTGVGELRQDVKRLIRLLKERLPSTPHEDHASTERPNGPRNEATWTVTTW